MARPRCLLVVLGTHTEVGKTFVGAQLLSAARGRGLRVAARKPAQSFEQLTDGPPTDAELLAAATGESIQAVCPRHRWYEVPMAPPMAADALGRSRITLAELLAEISWPEADLGLVETVGGPRSPLSHDADSIDLVLQLQPDRVLLIADAGLGSLNAIRLSLACVPDLPVDVFLNRFEPGQDLHELNRQWLRERYGIDAVTQVDELLARLAP